MPKAIPGYKQGWFNIPVSLHTDIVEVARLRGLTRDGVFERALSDYLETFNSDYYDTLAKIDSHVRELVRLRQNIQE